MTACFSTWMSPVNWPTIRARRPNEPLCSSRASIAIAESATVEVLTAVPDTRRRQSLEAEGVSHFVEIGAREKMSQTTACDSRGVSIGPDFIRRHVSGLSRSHGAVQAGSGLARFSNNYKSSVDAANAAWAGESRGGHTPSLGARSTLQG